VRHSKVDNFGRDVPGCLATWDRIQLPGTASHRV